VRHPGGGRSYAGMVSGGTLRPGDEVVVLPGGARSRIASVGTFDGVLEQAPSSMSVTLELTDDLDVGRGDLIAPVDGAPEVVRQFEATVCWFGEQPVEVGRRFRIKHTTRITPARLVVLEGRLDVDSLSLVATDALEHNDIGVGTIAVATPIAPDLYRTNRVTGSFVIIDEATNATVAAGMVGAPAMVGADAGTPR
jgi:sulfate adenylyltransferase subunit 1 (EFTu-like GTPase family)